MQVGITEIFKVFSKFRKNFGGRFARRRFFFGHLKEKENNQKLKLFGVNIFQTDVLNTPDCFNTFHSFGNKFKSKSFLELG